jgi:hypothetical protein
MNSQTPTSACSSGHFCSKRRPRARVCSSHQRSAHALAYAPKEVPLGDDAIGNRTSATINGIISTYNLPTTSHKLTSTTGGTNPRAFTYDAMGNLTSDGKYTYTYLNNGRINTVTWVTGTAPNTTTNTATYNINALGQRVRKVTPSSVVGTRRFMYDEAGRLAGEYDGAGKLIQETKAGVRPCFLPNPHFPAIIPVPLAF